MNANDAAKMFASILCVPGMNETVKIDLKISRKNVLLLSTGIERGLTAKDVTHRICSRVSLKTVYRNSPLFQ